MKIFILGPLQTKDYFGGVATFDEGLAHGFLSQGHAVFVFTDQNNVLPTQDLTVVRLNKKRLVQSIDIEKPDIIIAQLAYAKYLVGVNTSATKVYYLHAFFKQSYYGKIRSELAVIYQKALIKHFDYVISNSHFTDVVNRDFFGIKSDAVVHVGVDDKFYNLVANHSYVKKQKGKIFFASRLVPAKGGERLLRAINCLNKNNVEYTLYIAGDGIEKNKLENMAQKNQWKVNFLGRLDSKQMIEEYLSSEIFVSLDPTEPMGITFLEALICNCKIVCPVTGGQVELLSKYDNSVSFVDCYDSEDIARGISYQLKEGKLPELTDAEKEQYTYHRVAENLIDVLNKLAKKNYGIC